MGSFSSHNCMSSNFFGLFGTWKEGGLGWDDRERSGVGGGVRALRKNLGSSSESGIWHIVLQQECGGEWDGGVTGLDFSSGETRPGGVTRTHPQICHLSPAAPVGLAGLTIKEIHVSPAQQRNPISSPRSDPSPGLHRLWTMAWQPRDPRPWLATVGSHK